MPQDMKTTVQKIQRNRNKAVSKWLRIHLEIIGITSDDLEELATLQIHRVEDFITQRTGKNFRYEYCGINIANDTETHKAFIDGQQFGTTLKVRHEFLEKKVKVTISQVPVIHPTNTLAPA